MDITEFIEKVTAQFEEAEAPNIHPDVDFKLLDTWDSLTAFSIQMMIEDDYNVKVGPEDFKQTKTLLDLFNLVKSK